MTKIHTLTLTAAAAFVMAPIAANAETTKQELARLRAENAELKKENAKLKPPAPVKDKWVRQLSAGLLLTRGNTDTVTVTGGISAEKTTDNDKFIAFVNGAYGENNHLRNTQFIRAGSQYNRDFIKPFYWYVGTLLENDKIADLDFRLGVGPGLGVHLIKTDTVELNLEAGLAYYYEKYSGLKDDSSLRMRGAENFAYKFAPSAKFYQSFEIASDVSDTKNFIMNNEVGVESALSQNLKLRVSFLDRFVNQPPFGFKQNDIQLTSSIVLGF